MKFLQKKWQLPMIFFLGISSLTSAQTNILTVSPSFESGSSVGSGSSLDGGSWARTRTSAVSTPVQNLIYRQGLGNTTGAPAAQNGNYYAEAVTPNDPTNFNAHDKLHTENGQNLMNTLVKGVTYRVFFFYQNSAGHSFRSLMRTTNSSNIAEVVISTEATTWTEAFFDFNVPVGATSTDARLRFEFGLNAGTTRIDNIRIFDLATLPVELKSFNLTKLSNSVQLSWETLSETNNSHYEILRSSNGKEFSKLDVVTAKNKPATYFYEDKNPDGGVNYYKLIQYDFDGTAKEIATKAINYKISDIKLSIYPNPFTNEISVDHNSSKADKISISIVNISGQIIKNEVFKGDRGYNNYRLSTTDLPAGLYTLIYESEGVKEAYKIIK